MAIEDISHLVGHASTNVTEKVYRKELRPVLTKGARAMDALFDGGGRAELAVQSGWLVGFRRQAYESHVKLGRTQGYCWWAILGSNQ